MCRSNLSTTSLHLGGRVARPLTSHKRVRALRTCQTLPSDARSVVDLNPRIVADAAKCLSLGKHTRRARPKSFLRRPPRARRRPSEP
eukprot:scaffold82314_cov36-Phaeocystis_antarctica.AAC.2